MPTGRSEGRGGWGRDKNVFARNLAAAMKSRGWDRDDLAKHSGVIKRTLNRWIIEGTERPQVGPALKIADALGIGDYERLYDPNFDPAQPMPVDLGPAEEADTSDAADQDFLTRLARSEHVPAMLAEGRFRHWPVEDLEELAGTVGVGGALTREGVERLAREIEENRHLVSAFRNLLCTHHRKQLADLVRRLEAQSRVYPRAELGGSR